MPRGWNEADCGEKVGRLSATRKEFRPIRGYRTVAGLVIRSQNCCAWVKRAFILPIPSLIGLSIVSNDNVCDSVDDLFLKVTRLLAKGQIPKTSLPNLDINGFDNIVSHLVP